MIPSEVYDVANDQLQIPNQIFFSLTPDVHVNGNTCVGTTAVWDAANGYISPSIVGTDIGCGIRVYLTTLHKQDLADIRLKQKIIRAIEKFIPLTDQIPSHYRSLSLSAILQHGLPALSAKYRNKRSLSHVELSSSPVGVCVLSNISEHMKKRAENQLGTLGNGNHFIEIQSVTIPEENKEIARLWGLFEGQVIFLIHTGSRAWGKALAASYTEDFISVMEKLKLPRTPSNLLYLPLSHPVGMKYFHMMSSALNYAIVNRHLIGFGIENALKRIFGAKFQTHLLYDLMHNYALMETHQNQTYIVHRKGTTRALPALHPANPLIYNQTGHPALIPGSMGTPSYIMVGGSNGIENYYSICHGAGRIFANQTSCQQFELDGKSNTLIVDNNESVVLNRWTKERLWEESPATYKEVNQVTNTIVGAKLASIVAKCIPLIVIKAR